MNEEQLKKLITEHTNACAPDSEALWKKIEGRLSPKAPAAQTKRRFDRRNLAIFGTAAAGLIIVFGVTSVLGTLRLTNTTSPMENQDIAISESENLSADNDIAASESPADSAPVTKPLSYSELEFPSYSETILKCSGAPFGDSYFVEENVLAQTDLLISAEVARVYLSDDGESICCQLSRIEYYTETDKSLGDTLTIITRSKYPLRRGRRYLLPLKEENGVLHTVFDGIPQVEYTSSGGLVYFNGWTSLDAAGAEAILYEQADESDFFYDRMKFSRSGSVAELVEKWLSKTRADS